MAGVLHLNSCVHAARGGPDCFRSVDPPERREPRAATIEPAIPIQGNLAGVVEWNPAYERPGRGLTEGIRCSLHKIFILQSGQANLFPSHASGCTSADQAAESRHPGQRPAPQR